MKPPAFQFYVDDFLGGTVAMSLEEKGLYITLLCMQWSKGHVTADDIKRLGSAIAKPKLSHVSSKFKRGDDGCFRNERMEEERAKQSAFRVNRSESGKVGAAKRWHSHGTAIDLPMAKNSSPSPSPISGLHTDIELPPGFPKTVDDAIAQGQSVGCTSLVATDAWNRAVMRGGTDSKGNAIRSFPHYLSVEMAYARQRESREKATAPKQPLRGKIAP